MKHQKQTTVNPIRQIFAKKKESTIKLRYF